jgi:hypothetical protein
MSPTETNAGAIKDALAANNLDWTDITGDLLSIVWYDPARDDPTAIVQAVERTTVLEYQGERACPHDTVVGLRFAHPDNTLFCGYCDDDIPATEVRVLPEAIQCPVCGSTALGV